MIERVVVADSGPLIALARIVHLHLLQKLYTTVVLPPAVWNEVTVTDRSAPGAVEVRSASWITVESPDPVLVAPLAILVDAGEAEALALSQQPNALLLVDDSRARRIAERLDIRHIGTLGILRQAKRQGLIDAIRPLIDELIAQGIYIRQALIDAILLDADEQNQQSE